MQLGSSCQLSNQEEKEAGVTRLPLRLFQLQRVLIADFSYFYSPSRLLSLSLSVFPFVGVCAKQRHNSSCSCCTQRQKLICVNIYKTLINIAGVPVRYAET